MSSKFKTMKIFDCQNLPDTYQMLSEHPVARENCNVFIAWKVGEPEDGEDLALVDRWLQQNGAEIGEEILIYYGW